jgi:hypothetical protein
MIYCVVFLLLLMLPLTAPLSLSIHGVTGHLGRRVLYRLLETPSSPFTTINGYCKTPTSVEQILSKVEEWFPDVEVDRSSKSFVHDNTKVTLSNSPFPSDTTTSNTLICVPPSSLSLNQLSTRASTSDPDKTLYISSTGIYKAPGGEAAIVSTNSDVDSSSKLYDLESSLETGTKIIRFAGLYTLTRGAVPYYLKKSRLDGQKFDDGILNQISYSDASRVVVQALIGDVDGTSAGAWEVNDLGHSVALVYDGHGMLKSEAVECATRVGSLYRSKVRDEVVQVEFKKTARGVGGKRLMKPAKRWDDVIKFKSFSEFMDERGDKRGDRRDDDENDNNDVDDNDGRVEARFNY